MEGKYHIEFFSFGLLWGTGGFFLVVVFVILAFLLRSIFFLKRDLVSFSRYRCLKLGI